MRKTPLAAVLIVAFLVFRWLPASAQYPPPSGSCPLNSSATVAAAGDRFTLSTTLRDSGGNPVPSVNVLFRVDSQPGTDAGVGPLDQDFVWSETDSQGVATAAAYAGTTAGTVVFGLDCGAAGGSSASVTVSSNPTSTPTAVSTATPTTTPTATNTPGPTSTPSPAPFVVGLDCGNGIGVSCTIPYPASGALDVAVKLVNQAGGATELAALNFDVYDPDPTLLAVSATVPERDATDLPAAGWGCDSPAAQSDTGLFDKPDSFLGCFIQFGSGDVIATASTKVLGTVHYTKVATTGGTVHLTVFNVSVADDNAVTLLSCDIVNTDVSPPAPPVVSGPCVNVDIVFGAAPATNALTNVPTSVSCPDVNSDTKVNSADQLIVARSFSAIGAPQYVRDFDVNGDGRIDATDMLIQARVYGRC